ncbi:MAG: PDZ domain-containing protein [Vicinamibacterales bacterium]
MRSLRKAAIVAGLVSVVSVLVGATSQAASGQRVVAGKSGGAAAIVATPFRAGAVVVERSAGQDRPTVRVWRAGPGQAWAETIFVGGPRIGVTIADVEPGEGKAEAGVRVQDVSGGSPAEKAGIKGGDIIVEFDGERVRSAAQLTRLVRETPAGRQVKVVLMRDGKRVEVTVSPEADGRGLEIVPDLRNRVESLLRDFNLRGRNDLRVEPFLRGTPDVFSFSMPQWATRGRLGVTLQVLTPQLAEYFGVKEGVLVSAVADGSAAARAGVKAGDVVTAVNGTTVNDPGDVTRAVARAGEGGKITLTVVRDRKTQTIEVPLETGARGRRIPV